MPGIAVLRADKLLCLDVGWDFPEMKFRTDAEARDFLNCEQAQNESFGLRRFPAASSGERACDNFQR